MEVFSLFARRWVDKVYKAIFFDVDDTLLDFELCSKKALFKTFQVLQLDFTEEVYEHFREIDSRLWKKQKQGLISVQEVLAKRFLLLAQTFAIEDMSGNLRKQFEIQLGDTDILVSHAKEVVDDLSKKYTLYAASNGILKMQINRLEKAEILHYFKDLYVSDDIGFDKPDIGFFNECLKRSKLSREEVLFVGDSMEADMWGAKNAGINTCWYNSKGCKDTVGVTYVMNDLHELSKILCSEK